MSTPTEKQIALAIRLGMQVGIIKPQQRTQAHAMLAASTFDEVDKLIKAYNEKLGFEPKSSPATARQRSWIASLEKQQLGYIETGPRTYLTYAQADARIKYLRETAAAPTASLEAAPIIDLFTRKAV